MAFWHGGKGKRRSDRPADGQKTGHFRRGFEGVERKKTAERATLGGGAKVSQLRTGGHVNDYQHHSIPCQYLPVHCRFWGDKC